MKALLFLPGLAAAVLACVLVTSVGAKGPVDRIAISTPSGAAVQVTEGPELEMFSPWASGFLAGELAFAPDVDLAYRVDFYLDDGNSQQRIYSFSFYFEPHGRDGYVYLPGPGEPDYRMNIGTILASDGSWHNGAWHRASPAWAEFVASVIAIRPPRTGDAGLVQ